MLLSVERHSERPVGDLVGTRLLRLHRKALSATPVGTFNDGPQLPNLVGAIRERNGLRLALSHERSKVDHLL